MFLMLNDRLTGTPVIVSTKFLKKVHVDLVYNEGNQPPFVRSTRIVLLGQNEETDVVQSVEQIGMAIAATNLLVEDSDDEDEDERPKVVAFPGFQIVEEEEEEIP